MLQHAAIIFCCRCTRMSVRLIRRLPNPVIFRWVDGKKHRQQGTAVVGLGAGVVDTLGVCAFQCEQSCRILPGMQLLGLHSEQR